MTQEEHLNRIVAKCRELLAVAEKRTPGMWVATGRDAKDCRQYVKIRGTSLGRKYKIADLPFFIAGGGVSDLTETERDASFIASCAGPAEAGWRATIAAIEVMGDIKPLHALNPNDEGLACLCSDCCRTRHQWAARDTIIAAWPEELL